MSAQPPDGHYPACILPLYILARALSEAFPDTGQPTFDLRPYSDVTYTRPFATMPHEGQRRSFDIVVADFSPSRIGVELDLQLRLKTRPTPRLTPLPIPRAAQPDGLAATPPEAPRPEAEGDRRPDRVAVMLIPPFTECLLSEHLSATARWRDLRSIPRKPHSGRTFPEGCTFSFPRVAKALGAALREALAAGAAHAEMLEDTGVMTPVPAYFWRKDEAAAVLAADVQATMSVRGGRKATGTISFHGVALEPAWRGIWEDAASRMAPAKDPKLRTGTFAPVPRPTPWMVFMQQIARELGYSGGFPYGNLDLSGDDIGYYIQHRLEEMDPEVNAIGIISREYARAMAAFILHPSKRSAGMPSAEIGRQRAEFRKKYRLERFYSKKGLADT